MNIDYQAHGFKRDFGTWARTTDLHVTVTVRRAAPFATTYGVYVFHGHPGGQFWRNSGPLITCDSLEEALVKGEVLYGIVGARQFINVIDHQTGESVSL